MSEYLKAIYDLCEGLSLAYLVLGGLSLIYIALLLLDVYFLSTPRLSFVLRWFRFFLEIGYIYLISKHLFGLGGHYSLFALSGLIAIWGELSYAWFKAMRYSKRNILPFSNFVECENAWRPNMHFYKLKEEILSSGFEKKKSFKANNRLSLATLFYNKKEDIALLTLFALKDTKLRTLYFLVSKDENGKYLLFTNDFTENILFLRGEYSLHYRILSSFKGLLKVHKLRMKYSPYTYINFEKESENLPHLLYNNNLQEGLKRNIYSQNQQEELLTAEGKFQFCKKLIIKNYFRI